MTSASELAAGGLRRIRNIFEGFAFGFIAGAVSAVTAEFIRHYQEIIVTEEKIKSLNNAVTNQAKAWHLLPEPIGNATTATIALYNAQLQYLQLLKQDEGEALEKQIEHLKQIRYEAEINAKAQPVRDEYFRREMGRLDVQIAETQVKLEQWNNIMKQQPTTINKVTAALEKVNTAMGKNTELVESDIYKSRDWLTTNLAYMEYLKTEEENFRQRLLNTPLDIYWSPSDEEINRKTSAILNATKAAALAEEQLYMARQQQSPYEQYTQDIVAGSSPVARAIFEGEEKLRIMQEFQQRETALIVADMAAKLQLAQMRGASEIEIAMMTAQNTMEIEEVTAQHKEMMERIKMQVGIATLGQSLAATGSMMMQGSQKQFEIGKKLALAGAIVSGAQAVANALATPPFPLGLALAALAAAQSAMQINLIKNTEFMGGATAFIGAGGIGGAPSPIFGAGSTPTSLTEQEKQSQPFTINLTVVNPLSDDNWAKITEEQIVPYLEKYTERGGTVNLNIG